MPRPKKDNHPVTIRISTSLLNRLNQFCEDSGQPKTTAMERALAAYMDSYYEDMKKLEEIKNGK